MRRQGLIGELGAELNMVLRGRQTPLDSIVPPLLFVIVNAGWGLQPAAAAALVSAVAITLVRLVRRQPLMYAAAGIAGVLVAVIIAALAGRASGYFVPGLVTGALTALLCAGSVAVGRPLVALTSSLTRGWPLDWYAHPRVRPAYNEATLLWAVFFGLRVILQWSLMQADNPALLFVFNILGGWPATIVLLIATYLYGLWRLARLRGPSVEEFQKQAPPPWVGQVRGF